MRKPNCPEPKARGYSRQYPGTKGKKELVRRLSGILRLRSAELEVRGCFPETAGREGADKLARLLMQECARKGTTLTLGEAKQFASTMAGPLEAGHYFGVLKPKLGTGSFSNLIRNILESRSAEHMKKKTPPTGMKTEPTPKSRMANARAQVRGGIRAEVFSALERRLAAEKSVRPLAVQDILFALALARVPKSKRERFVRSLDGPTIKRLADEWMNGMKPGGAKSERLKAEINKMVEESFGGRK